MTLVATAAGWTMSSGNRVAISLLIPPNECPVAAKLDNPFEI